MDRRLDQDPGPDTARRGRHRQAQRRRHGLRTVVASVLIGGLTLIGIGLVAMALWVDEVSAGIDISTMPEHLPGVNSTILDAHGNQLARVASTENRIPEPASRISPWLVRATIAIEDRRFYQHGGVDYLATLRALWADMTAGQIVQGGSTIEQQLAKLLYLNDSQTLTRKVQEAVIANQIADRWSRSRILTTYLNVVPYGGVTYGCEAAARLYFGRHCADLTPLQAATLAGLPRSPTDYDPLLHPRAAIDRRNEVLSAMASNGDLTPRFAARLSRRPLGLHEPGQQVVHQAYFVQYVEHRLRKRFGERRLQRGGLVVSTTLDQRLQAAAEGAFDSVLTSPDDPAAALVAMDPRTGALLAFDASTNPRDVHFDLPSQAHRQAGSAFKPFALLAAMLDDHIDPETTEYSAAAPFTTTLPNCDPIFPSCTWTVNNAEPGGSGMLNLHQALDGSVNAVYARLSMDIGADPTVDMAYRLGIPRSDRLPRVPSIVLGTGLVTPLDMTSAYATIADGGVYHRPLAVTQIRSASGKVHDVSPPSANPGAAGHPGVGGVGGDVDPAGQHHLPARPLHGRRCAAVAGQARGRQDRHGRVAPRRLVLRLHAVAGGLRLDGLPAGRGIDDSGGRQRRVVRRGLPGDHLAPVHDLRAGGRAAAVPARRFPHGARSGRVVPALGVARPQLSAVPICPTGSRSRRSSMPSALLQAAARRSLSPASAAGRSGLTERRRCRPGRWARGRETRRCRRPRTASSSSAPCSTFPRRT